MLIDLTKPAKLSPTHVGGKAFNLHKLTMMGVPVPPALAVRASLSNSMEVDRTSFRQQILGHPIVQTGNKFAVRSSGVGEDGEGNSCAGIFESYLNVEREDLYDAVQRVWKSLGNSRSSMYSSERSISIESMGVVIQHMIDADFAGVSFSVCPIEKDDRIALIEVVQGNGETLVSGTKTPATMRVNRLTGMTRISRKGADKIEAETLDGIADKLLPYIERIEEHYSMPVDIEWAIADDQVHILQTRPITT